VKARINGDEHELADGTTVADLLRTIGAPPAGIAVAVNEHVVPGTRHASTALADGDRVEIIRAVAGG
jgi:sulfur carrier protein